MGASLMPPPAALAAPMPGAEQMAAPPVDPAILQQQQQDQAEAKEKRKKGLIAIYGEGFPLAMDTMPQDADWSAWAEKWWGNARPGVQQAVYTAERNRLFRAGIQYLSRNGQSGQYKEPAQPKDSLRLVDNQIRPALAWALQVVSEQRPGWRFSPVNADPDRQRKAEAWQIGTEYQWRAQKMALKIKEAGYWAQTDGVSFMMTWWNPEKGPDDNFTGPDSPVEEEQETGQAPTPTTSYDSSAQIDPDDIPAPPQVTHTPAGDVDTCIYRIDQVRVSAEATSTISPMIWFVKEVIPKSLAVGLYGSGVADEMDAIMQSSNASQYSATNHNAYNVLHEGQETVSRYTIFCDKNSQWLPGGLTVIIVGKKVVLAPRPLVMGRVPMIRVTDGSEDPAFFCTPVMNELVAPQMRLNMMKTKLYESIRVNAGGRFLSKSGALVTETLIGGQLSAIEVRGAGPISDAVQPVTGFSVGEDTKFAIEDERKSLQDRHGWNDTARGQFTADQSGRAILAIREQLERTFAPFVGALAVSMEEWAQQNAGWMRYGYVTPRALAVTGQNRPDLARELTAADFDDEMDVFVDPETLTPMPRALKLWLLEDGLSKGVYDMREYRRRMPFAWTQDDSTPDEQQEARAKRICELLRQGQDPGQPLWQDDEKIHQDVLERDIILAAGTDPQVQQAALQYWDALGQQAQQKAGPPPPPDPNSPEGHWQHFLDTANAVVVQDAVQLVAKEAALSMQLMPPKPAGPGAPVPGQTAAPHPPQNKGGRPPSPDGPARHNKGGMKMSPDQQPTFGSSPSVAAAPVAMQKGGGTDQENAAKLFEQSPGTPK